MNDGKLTVGNVCFIMNDKNQVLLLKRAREPMRGLYTGVGGKTNFDEDIRASCEREITEETGLKIYDLEFRAVVKTILEDNHSAWLLFVYTAKTHTDEVIECPEGELGWINVDSMNSLSLIGFIREISTYIINKNGFLEGCIHHDKQGKVLRKELTYSQNYEECLT